MSMNEHTIATAPRALNDYWSARVKPTKKAWKNISIKKPIKQKSVLSPNDVKEAELVKAVSQIHKMNTGFKIEAQQETKIVLSMTTLIRLAKAYIKHRQDIEWVDVVSSSREFRYLSIRHCLMYLAKRHTTSSLAQIGRALGGRDHSTVSNGVACIYKHLSKTGFNKRRDYGPDLEPLERLAQMRIAQLKGEAT